MNAQKHSMDNFDVRLTLLGTGGPTPVMERFGPSILVEAGEEKLLIDAGRGAIQRLMQLKQPIRQVRSIFLTHLHSDHTVGLPDLWLTGWLNGRPVTPLRVWGPRGTRDMMKYLDLAFNYDIRIRSFDDRLPPEGAVVLAEDIEEGIIYDTNGVSVTAFEVDHAPIQPAFGYRIDYIGRSVVVCGDTRFSEHLISYAKSADVLVHEVIAPDLMRGRGGGNSEAMERVIEHHTIPEKAGEVFARANPRLAVYSHIIPVTATADDIIPQTRKTYSGPLEIGEDLMVINIGEEVTVHRFNE
ncbi:MAG: MBL fold metallo-hydrolase [Dehalococcoidales bacterium]|nr:MAG: MBL fold metallo-hydrolase [Dehalococcoidales bacterium]